MSRAEAQAVLTGPGGMFEVTTDTVDGLTMKVYKDRLRSLREVAAMGQSRGDAEEYVVYGDRRYGFGTFVAQSNSVSRQLTAAGVAHGDRIAILSANNPQWVLAFWGSVDLGAIVVGLNGWWKTDEIVYGLQDSSSRILIADRGRFERVVRHLDECPALSAVYLIDADPAEFGSDPGLHRFDELLTKPGPDLPTVPIDEADPAVIFYTSGTTGRPKGAISTHRSMIANLQNTVFNAVLGAMQVGAEGARAESQTASLLTSPMFHVSGCHSGIVVGMLAGVKLVIPVGKFEPEKAMALIQDERISVWATVPTMVWRVVEHPDRDRYDLSSVTSVATGGSAAAGELQRQVRATFSNVRTLGNAYGLTESSSVATVNSGEDFLRRPDSVGLPMPVVDLKVVDASGTDVGTGRSGEVWIKGPIIMPGYWGKPEATASTITDGWLHTGDVGYLDDDGFLFITDRAKDMIIRGGENVYCVEIENRLLEHPAVLDAAVIGVPHQSLGEEVKAIVEVEPGAPVTAGELRAWVAETLANFKVPAYVEITSAKLPRNASGKLLKNVLRGEGEVSFAETM
ncbi:MAG: class I adenylate-forming enzyme family protein [Acidimicrobiales bacterium]